MRKVGINKQGALRRRTIDIASGKYKPAGDEPKAWAPAESYAGMELWVDHAKDGVLLRTHVRLSRFRRELNKYMRLCSRNPMLDVVVMRNNKPIGVTSGGAIVLGQAAVNTGEHLGLSYEELHAVIGDISTHGISPDSDTGKKALLLVRLFKILHSVVGSDKENIHHWMGTRISTLDGVPAEIIQQEGGLERVIDYIETFNR